MKVMYITHIFPNISETFISNEILEVQRNGHEVIVFSLFSPASEVPHKQLAGINKIVYAKKTRPIYWIIDHAWCMINFPAGYLRALFHAGNPKNGLFKCFLTMMGVVRLIYKHSPDHVHAHFGLTTTDVALILFLVTKVPYSFTTHGYDIFSNPPKNYKIKTQLSKAHIAVSNFNKRYIENKYGADCNKIIVVYCGIDFTRNFPVRNMNADNIIVSVARLEHVKGLDVLVKACYRLKKKGINFVCNIIGDGSKKNELLSLIHSYGLDTSVHLLGAKSQEDVFQNLAESKIMVLPSRSEAMGVALMEAMAMMVSVIGPKVCGVHELIEDGESGFLVPPEDEIFMADRIIELLGSSQLREKFTAAGYRKVYERFNLQTEVKKLISIWNS